MSARDLSAKLAGLASISDQSGGRTLLRLSGPHARDVLAKGLPIDLDPRAFPLGSAATSAISHMGGCWQLDDTRSYNLFPFPQRFGKLLELAVSLCGRVRLRGRGRQQPIAISSPSSSALSCPSCGLPTGRWRSCGSSRSCRFARS